MDLGANTILLTDSYKISHHLQYPPDITSIFSYFESRGGKWKKTLFFGLQIILKKYLSGVVVTQQMVEEADEFFKQHFSGCDVFNRSGWELIVTRHGGKLPVRIRAVPEGSLVTTSNVLFTVENTDPDCSWITNYLETLLVQAWYPMTVATNSWNCRKVLQSYLEKTADSMAGLEFLLHDFGFRGVSSVSSAGLGGAAHLVSFAGTDTIPGVVTARQYYGADMAGYSIPATEHSTMTTWGKKGEAEAVLNVMNNVPSGGLAIVVDSYDIWNMLDNIIGEELRDQVEARQQHGGFLVVRPDSGDPKEVLRRVFDILGDKFGFSTNSKGFKVLPQYIRVIQGDGISYDSLGHILESVSSAGWSTENLTFGSGGALLQRLDRDTQKCAYKCSHAVVGGEEREVYKDPVTDPGKKSKKGRLVLVKDGEEWRTVKEEERGDREDMLVTVFENGEMVKTWTWQEVKARAAES